MTLTMILYAKKNISPEFCEPLFYDMVDRLNEPFPEEGPHTIDTLQTTFCIFRNVTSIHNWFVENLQNGEDDYREYTVPKEILNELHQAVCDVLNDHERAEELLPVSSGFSNLFFPKEEYDEHYFEDLLLVKNKLEIAIRWTMYGWYFCYDSCWEDDEDE